LLLLTCLALVLRTGCSQLLCQIFNVLFIAGVVGWYAVMKITGTFLQAGRLNSAPAYRLYARATEIEHQKLAYTLVALYGLFLNLTCFAIHVWQSRVFRQVGLFACSS
jgi:hypothetical protein